MHDDRVHSTSFISTMSRAKLFLEVFVDHRIPAVLHDDSLAGKTLDIGQRFSQYTGDVLGCREIHGHSRFQASDYLLATGA